MKMFLGNTPINFMNLTKTDISTSDADIVASDLQAGKICYARGTKVTGTGKSFEFASYGAWKTNLPNFVPSLINVIQIGSKAYPIRMTVLMEDMVSHDFSTAQQIAETVIDGVIYPITVSVKNNILSITCDKSINIELISKYTAYTSNKSY